MATKIKAAPAPSLTAAQVTRATDLGWNNAGSNIDATAFLASLKANYKLARDAVIVGATARYLAPANATALTDDLRAKAITVITKSGNGTKVNGKKARTVAEQRAYDGARQVWSRMVRNVTPEKVAPNSGNQNAAKKGKHNKATTAPTAQGNAPTVAKIPTLVNRAECVAWAHGLAAMLRTVTAKNGKAMPVDMKTAIVDFAKAMDAFEESPERPALQAVK